MHIYSGNKETNNQIIDTYSVIDNTRDEIGKKTLIQRNSRGERWIL